QRRRPDAATIEGDGNRELSDRRLWTAAHRITRQQGSGRLGDEVDARVGSRERAPGNVALRPRLAESSLRRVGGDATRLSADRVPDSVDAGNERPDRGRSEPR